MTMTIDDAIANVAYILDCLMSYRDIINSGDCNTCAESNGCRYEPKPGQMVRYNCPHYTERGANDRERSERSD